MKSRPLRFSVGANHQPKGLRRQSHSASALPHIKGTLRENQSANTRVNMHFYSEVIL